MNLEVIRAATEFKRSCVQCLLQQLRGKSNTYIVYVADIRYAGFADLETVRVMWFQKHTLQNNFREILFMAVKYLQNVTKIKIHIF